MTHTIDHSTAGWGRPMHDLNVLALFKGDDRFIFVYDDESRPDLLNTIRNLAASPDSSLNWFDAAVLTERAKQQLALTPPNPDPEAWD